MTAALTIILAAVNIAFPRPGASLPAIDRCYVIGAAPPGTTNVVVQGRPVAVHPLGGWVAMVDLVPGTNTVAVADTNVTFTVAAKRASSASSAAPPPRKYEKLPYAADELRVCSTNLVVIDPGHGGDDTGALSPHSLPEKDANLRMAKAVRTELEKLGYKVEMTRETDDAVPLYDRPRSAHKGGAAAFVSIHHNAPPYDKDPRDFRYHAVYAWNDPGEKLAKAINSRMAETLGGALKNNGVLHANFAVTRSPEIPSCLIEVDFVTTPEAELDSWNPSRRKKIAAAIALGIADFAKK